MLGMQCSVNNVLTAGAVHPHTGHFTATPIHSHKAIMGTTTTAREMEASTELAPLFWGTTGGGGGVPLNLPSGGGGGRSSNTVSSRVVNTRDWLMPTLLQPSVLQHLGVHGSAGDNSIGRWQASTCLGPNMPAPRGRPAPKPLTE